jgi:hypothetical protein
MKDIQVTRYLEMSNPLQMKDEAEIEELKEMVQSQQALIEELQVTLFVNYE